jgi:hypothetical protein
VFRFAVLPLDSTIHLGRIVLLYMDHL